MIRTGASIAELRGVSHARSAGGGLCDLSLAFRAGCLAVVRGEAGCGKESLLRLLGLFERPDSGTVLVEGRETRGWSEEQCTETRAQRMGLLFAAPFLLPSLSVAENIAMPLFRHSGADPQEAARRAEELLAFAGLAQRAQTPAGELSVEEQYAAAVARALVQQPPLLLVEELDAALEGEPLRRVTALLRQAAETMGTAVVATASPDFAAEAAHRTLDLTAGRLEADSTLPRVGTV